MEMEVKRKERKQKEEHRKAGERRLREIIGKIKNVFEEC